MAAQATTHTTKPVRPNNVTMPMAPKVRTMIPMTLAITGRVYHV